MASQRKVYGSWSYVLLVYNRRGLKVNAVKSKVMVLGKEEGVEYEVYVDKMHMPEFKYFGYVLDESGTDEAECCKRDNGRRVAGVRCY